MPRRSGQVQEIFANAILFLGGVSMISCGLGALWLSGEPDRHSVQRAQQNTTISQISSFQQAIEQYQKDHGQPPSAKQVLAALLSSPRGMPGRGYLNDVTSIPRDPWGDDYVYRCPGPEGAPYEIVSYGADGRPGGTGWDTDISSTQLSQEVR